MYYKPSILSEDIAIKQIYTIHYFEYYKDYRFSGESHNFWEILYVDKGEVLVTSGSKHINLQSGQLIFHKPGEFHTISANGVIAPNTIVISFDCLSPSMKYFENKILYASDHEKSCIARIIAEAKGVYETDLNDPLYKKLDLKKEPQFGGRQLIKIYLQMMLIELIRKGRFAEVYQPFTTIEHKSSQQNTYISVLNYIDNNLTEPLTISKISKNIMISRSSLENLFKKNSGMSIVQYFRNKRIERAKLLIRQGNLNFTQISELLCFNSLHYFSRTFKQITDMSPTEYAISTKAMIDHSTEAPNKN